MAEIHVETFEATESETLEDIDQVQALVDELGLEGQQALVHPSGERLAFREMTAEEAQVYHLLLPVEAKLNDYDFGPIPVRVLQVIKEVRRHFTPCDDVEIVQADGTTKKVDDRTGLFVWHPRSAADKDPLLVGLKQADPTEPYGQSKTYILARWGEVLESYNVLRERAFNQALRQYRTKLESVVQDASVAAARVKDMSGEDFQVLVAERRSIPAPYFHGTL